MYYKEIKVEGHKVALKIGDDAYVTILVDGLYSKVYADPEIKLAIAMAARRLWKEALAVLPPGEYYCYPTCDERRRLYITAGWKPSPTDEWELVFYNKTSA